MVGFSVCRYELPDGQVITVDSETRFGVAETLFNPSLFPNAKVNGVEEGVVELLLNSIRKCDGDLQPDLCGNIVLSGGSSMFPGLRARMLSELNSKIGNDDIEMNVITDSQRKYAAWIGGSMFGSRKFFIFDFTIQMCSTTLYLWPVLTLLSSLFTL